MADPIVNQAAQQMADQALQQGAGSGQPQAPDQEVSASDQAQFDQSLNGQQEVTAESNAQAVQTTEQAGQCDTKHSSLGDAILNGLESLKVNHDAHMQRIQQQLAESGGGSMTIQDALRLQFEVMQMGIEQDLTTKMADKTSQGVQTLFRNQ